MKFGQKLHEKLRAHIANALPAEHEPKWKRIGAVILLTCVGLFLTFLFIATVTVAVLSIGLPDVRDFDKLAGTESTIIYDREGGILYTIHGEENRQYVPLENIFPLLQKATIAIEDDEFYSHSGFDVPGIIKGSLYEIFGIGTRRGGSTITQQLAKNAFLSPKRSYIRKLKELILAIRLERAYSKDKILELYLNRIPYGNNAYGAEMASKMYFNKSASELTLAEAAVLASLPKAPTYYSPYGPNLNSKLNREFTDEAPKTIQDLSENDYTIGLIGREVTFSEKNSLYLPGRADIVLRRMEELENIAEEDRTSAVAQIQSTEFTKYREAIRAAHFVFYIRELLEEQFGKDVVAQGGLQVYTTLNPKLQAVAEESIAKQIEYSKDAHGVSTAALFGVNAVNGEILAMVGSADYFDAEAHGNVNHVFARRQPGSSFKPIVYAKAFLNRYAPATVLYDTPTDFGSGYRPDNYEGTFKGPMPIRRALGQSRNIPALKAYFLAGQQEEIIPFAENLGITTLDPNGDYGPPLAIGAAEVTLYDMVQAFSVFSQGGIKRPFHSILKVTDRGGEIMYEYKPEETIAVDALDPQIAYEINSILSDKSVYLGPRLDVPGHTTAAKTGTSNKEITPVKILPSNLWTVGYTPTIVAGVWAGNSDGSALKLNADGYNVAVPVWSKFMSAALKETPNETFKIPEGIKTVTVSKASGKLPNAQTPENSTVTDIFASFAVPTEYDDIYAQVEVNDLDNKLPNEFTPQEYIKKKVFANHHDPIGTFPSWLAGIKKWVEERRKEDPTILAFPPAEITDMFTAETSSRKPVIQIIFPAPLSIITEESIKVTVQVDAPNGVEKVVFFLGDRSVPNSVQRKAPYTGTIRFGAVKPGENTITAKVYDKIGYIGEAKIEIRVER